MGPPLYMQFVVDRNLVMRHVIVVVVASWRLIFRFVYFRLCSGHGKRRIFLISDAVSVLPQVKWR